MNPSNLIVRVALGLLLAGSMTLNSCTSPTAVPPPPPPPPPPPASGVGPAGGTVSGPSGAQVVIPAGALGANTAITITQSSSGAPALPVGMTSFGQMFAFTPHGTTFAAPVTVTVPFDPTSVPAGRTPILYKTTAGQLGWERVSGATVNAATMTAQVTSFSFLSVGNAPPTISTQPQDAKVIEPAPASFSVTASGAPPLTFQWERSDDGGVSWVNASGPSATTDVYSTAPTSAATDDKARYRVIVRNPDGPTTSTVATLTVAPNIVAPTITTHPSNVSVAVGGNATFTVIAAGTNPTYQWQRSNGGGAFANIAGATNASYTVTNAQLADNGARFQVVVTNSAGTVTSNPATLTVTTAPQPIPQGPYLAAGQNFSLARSTIAGLVSWGSDASGQLGAGLGDQTRDVPGSAGVNNAVAIAAGSVHGLAVRATGEIVGWGSNTSGQLSNGGATVESPLNALDILSTPINGAVSACGGMRHSLVLRSTAPYVLGMGDNSQGQLGDGSTTNRQRAVPIPTLASPVQAVACGADFSLALVNGVVYAWGANASGQLGNGSTTPSSVPVAVVGLATFPGAKVVAIAAGKDHALALIVNDHGISVEVRAWGSNLNGKLGPNGPVSGNQIQTTPVLVGGLPTAFPGVAGIAAGDENSVAVLKDGHVHVWGINQSGQLGRGSVSPPGFDAVPGPANLPGSCFALEVAVGRNGGLSHLLARCVNGSVYAWGGNSDGRLGLGSGNTNPIVSTPTLIPGLFILAP